MTADTAPRPTAPAIGLFGGGKPAPQAAEPQAAVSDQGEPTSTQRKSFADLFRADGTELHAA
ncbi:hypothetical protein [Novosphingobium sp. Gsoil 351]|uniref:hypothetical protein n=1 Tax=Novosphingobium sp. Gsoil 351 TaxID=2675225 RepID=UPI0012B4E1EA|nr:hypothetical protein [Novosphingobium sp. Gsoil 351]QGN54251.1 hypothetical protein GKE62_06510 [Novosphingobium sp. Gsoil 351]